MLLLKNNFLFKWLSLIMTISLSIEINFAHAVFGQSDGRLEDYYEFGRNHTGVAAIHSIKREGFALGTANLVDVNIDALKGRLMLTDAHVLNGTDANSCSVRFIDQNNNSFHMGVKAIYFSKDYKKSQQDIGFIVLSNPADTEKFKPLKLNLTRDNESLVGSQISIVGCSDSIGHLGSNTIIEEGITCSLRRGMQVLLRYGSNANPQMHYVFHHHTGFIRIERNEESELTAEARIRNQEIEREMRELEALIARNKKEKTTDENSENKFFKLWQEQRTLPKKITREALSQKLLCDETFKNQLASLQQTDDLDKDEIIKKWNQFSSSKEISTNCLLTEKSISLGKYQISMFAPLPLLSGMTYYGDSGGAWIIENEIVALTKGGYLERDFNDFNVVQHVSSNSQLDLRQYFIKSEKLLKKSLTLPLLKKDSVAGFGTSIWSCKNWIESTIKKITSDLDTS